MCDPISVVSLASLAIGTASSVGGFIQQGKQAKQKSKAMETDYAQQMQTLQTQYDQTNKQATDDMSQRAREAMIESARLHAISGESGLAGNSMDRIQNESAFNQDTDIASIESNRQASLKQIFQQGQQIRSGRQSQMNDIQRPSLIGTGLQIAGTAVNSAASYNAAKNKLPVYVTG